MTTETFKYRLVAGEEIKYRKGTWRIVKIDKDQKHILACCASIEDCPEAECLILRFSDIERTVSERETANRNMLRIHNDIRFHVEVYSGSFWLSSEDVEIFYCPITGNKLEFTEYVCEVTV